MKPAKCMKIYVIHMGVIKTVMMWSRGTYTDLMMEAHLLFPDVLFQVVGVMCDFFSFVNTRVMVLYTKLIP